MGYVIGVIIVVGLLAVGIILDFRLDGGCRRTKDCCCLFCYDEEDADD